ncbi:GNAT family N-acetyltransferase [Actinoplanes sp. TBRC 11911]|uniref:GNAT family N-acetyltransferase n=1 Tax=Actinoplanes sp. TBRC 11911 TaxID=2729386 RepID=UPI00145CCE37|nr:GNAT family protein [Actinoplanes sp. TBRC 11911]NMO51028.1 GNAT family N-acetyltransferase [Actinoplanes sp. TBRC 11911]
MIVRHGELTFRPASVADIDVFEAQFGDVDGAGAYQWFGFTSFAGLRREAESRGLLGGDANMLVIEHKGELAGRVEWLARYWGRRDTSLCWEIAIGLLPAYRGMGIGTASQRWLVDYLFAHTRVERIQATTDPENVAEQKCLERAGLRLEGRVRRAQWRQGAWHDQLLYAITRDDSQPT